MLVISIMIPGKWNVAGQEEITSFDVVRAFLDRILVTVLTQHAQFYALNSNYDGAIHDLDAAAELDPNNPKLHTLRGQMYLALYEWDEALADFNAAIELRSNYADAFFQRGVLYYSILQTGVEMRPNALADFQHYLKLAPEGEYAERAGEYIENIQTELAALEE
jgi:tetratricopeptide (TPR) repeat protein